jgi:hypothetical protein
MNEIVKKHYWTMQLRKKIESRLNEERGWRQRGEISFFGS